MVLSLAACGGDGKAPKDTSAKDTTLPMSDSLPAGIEKKDYKGTVNILMPDWSLYTKCFDPGDDMTDILNKSLYNRENKVEAYLGVDITYEHVPTINDYIDPVVAAITTNDDLYQILLTHCALGNQGLITNGYLTDMNNLDIDFTGEWFNQKSNNALEVDGKQFYCISDYMIPDPNVMVFNTGMIENLHLENPYDLVRSGEWTLDKLTEMASSATSDNGDSIWDHNDTYGFATPDDWFLTSFISAADVKVVNKNESGEYELVFGDDKTYTFMDKLHTLINGPDTYVFDYRGIQEPNSTYVEKAITIQSGRTLFTLQSFSNFWNIRDIDTAFGILPFPKLDEEQEEYYSLDWSGLMCVPASVSDSSYEMVGDTIELLSYYSAEEVVPAYIENTLGMKFARDDNWQEMLEIIFDSILFDPSISYFYFTEGVKQLMFSPVHMLVKTGENSLASWIATHGPAAETSIANFNDAVKDIGE